MAVITVYAGARVSMPVDQADLSWGEIADELALLANEPPGAPPDASREEQKKAMVAWGPHALRAGATRGNAGVDAVTMLAIDVDAGDPEAVVARLRDAGVAGVVYESPSSTPEAPRFRVVSPLAEPVAPERCRDTRLAFAEALGIEPGAGVEECCEPGRLFFIGRLHGTPERRVWRVEGEAVHEAELPAPTLAWGAAKAPAIALAPLAALPPADAGIAAALGPADAHAGRKWHICGALGGVMRKMGYSAAQCEAVVRAWLPAGRADVDIGAGVKRALCAWAKPADAVSGHGDLARWLGESHADVVERACWSASFAGRVAAARPAPATSPWRAVTGAPAYDALGERRSFADPETPLEYYCAGLRLAPSDGKISLIAGMPGAGKGPIADHLAVCFTFGLPAFGIFPCRKSRVLLLDCEGLWLSMRRIRRMCRALGVDARDIADPRNVSGVSLLSDATYYAIEAEAPEVVVLDSYTSAMLATGVDSFKPEFAQLARMLGALGVLVLAVAHANKKPEPGERPTLGHVAGSFALASLAATGIASWHPDYQKAPNRVELGCMRAPEMPFESLAVEFSDVAGDGLAVTAITSRDIRAAEARAAVDERVALANKILTWFRRYSQIHQQSREALLKAGLGVNNTDGREMLSAVLAELADAGFLTLDATHRTHTYKITSPQATTTVVLDAAGRFVPGASSFQRAAP